MKWYLKVFKQYADFSGRARRMEYWMFTLFNIIAICVTIGLDFAIGTFGAITGLYYLFIIIPSLAVCVRRLHDINKSGWMYFVLLIPIIGGIWLLVLFLTDGDRCENQYGPDPKEIEF